MTEEADPPWTYGKRSLRPRFYPVFHLGNVVSIVLAIGGGTAAWTTLKVDGNSRDLRIARLEEVVRDMATVIKQVAESQINEARRDERQANIILRLQHIDGRMDRFSDRLRVIEHALKVQEPKKGHDH